MPAPRKGAARTSGTKATSFDRSIDLNAEIQTIMASLKRMGSKRFLNDMSQRYGIVVPNGKVIGVPVGKIQQVAKQILRERDRRTGWHELALALWETGWYEARMLAAFVDEPDRVTAAQMDRWCRGPRGFDNWGIVDTVCFKLFDQTPFAFEKARQWAASPSRNDEFVRRAGFVLMACLAGHDKTASDARFLALLPLIEQGAHDDRNFVKKGVSWALRMIGRRNRALHEAALATAERLSRSEEGACKWIGKDALRELANPKLRSRLARRDQ